MLISTTERDIAIVQSSSPSIENMIAAWLHAKGNRSGSARTLKAYRATIAEFRFVLQSAGLDLDSDQRAVRLIAQSWAGESRRASTVTASTFNTRLGIVSSFYGYAVKVELLQSNPITRLDRRSTHSYASARPIAASAIRDGLAAIDRATLTGKRDFALLTVALTTGRRLAELAALRLGDVSIAGDLVTLTFRHCKGGKVMVDTLSNKVTAALLDYLHASYGERLSDAPISAPIWVSKSNRSNGKAIGVRAISGICEARLGVSKVHALRHSFAHSLESIGAPVSQIQAKLGHSSLATTGRYLASLSRAENPFADQLSDAFGI